MGQLAIGIMRSNVPPRALLVHRDSAVHRLERAAAFGGRSTTWYYGNVGAGPGPAPIHTDRDGVETVRSVPGPLVSLDVRAMYPSIMARELLPTRLLKHIIAPSVAEMWDWCEHWGVIARVTIKTRRAEYPYRAAKGIAYPLGQFSTVLTGPELSTLRTDGEVIQCHEMAVFHLTNALSAGAQALLGDGQQAKCASGATMSASSKLLRNSLAGKMAQRNGQWRRELALDVPHKWGIEESIDAQTERRNRTRWVNGWAWAWDEDKDGAGPHTAVFAYITAHGRVMMRRWRDRLPPRTVVSQDTDGLWVLPSPQLTELGLKDKDDCSPGELGAEGEVAAARFWGPKHYWTDRGWTLSGLHNPVAGRDLAEVWHTTVMPAWGHKTKRVPDSVYVQTQKCGLTISHPYQTVQPDGWAIPRMIHPPRESGPEIPD